MLQMYCYLLKICVNIVSLVICSQFIRILGCVTTNTVDENARIQPNQRTSELRSDCRSLVPNTTSPCLVLIKQPSCFQVFMPHLCHFSNQNLSLQLRTPTNLRYSAEIYKQVPSLILYYFEPHVHSPFLHRKLCC